MADRPAATNGPPRLAQVRAAGRVYARHANAATTALVMLHDALVAAYEAGATVSQLAECSGLARPTIYRHLQRDRTPWPGD